jgi:Protein of unknown function (DUF2584)
MSIDSWVRNQYIRARNARPYNDMGMPCEINSILKLNVDYPDRLVLGAIHNAEKSGYRIVPIDVPIQLVNANWQATADIIIRQLTWENQTTKLRFEIVRIYAPPIALR